MIISEKEPFKMGKWNLRQQQILWRAFVKEKRLSPYLSKDAKTLDIGSGNGGLVFLLKEHHSLNIHALDISDKSAFPEIKPIIYDGKNLPFPDESFHTALLITVLHHTHKPAEILREAVRVSSGQILVMEDIYSNSFQKYLTFFMDSLVNQEFKGHPHSNKSDKEWKDLFTRLSLEVEDIAYYRFALFFKQVLYVLKKKKGRSE